MCNAISEDGRRCPVTRHTLDRANQNRVRARAQRRAVAGVFRDNHLPGAAHAIMASRPSDMLMVATRLEEVNPSLAGDIRAAVGGQFPGAHNAVLLERRAAGRTKADTHPVAADLDKNGRIREDPNRVTMMQKSLLTIEESLLEEDVLGADVNRAELERSVSIRRRAIDAGVFRHTDEPSPEAEAFFATADLRDLHHLNDVQRGISQRMYDHAFHHGEVHASQRTPTAVGQLFGDSTVASALKAIEESGDREAEVADGVILRRDDKGRPYLSVDEGTGRAVHLASPILEHQRLDQVLPRIAKIENVAFDPKVDAPDSQAAVYEAAMSPRTKQGAYNQDKLAASLTAAAFAADRAPGRKQVTGLAVINDSIAVVRRNVARSGKSPSVTMAALTSSGHRTSDPTYEPEGGWADSALLRRSNEAYTKRVHDLVKRRNGGVDPETLTVQGSPRPSKRGRYTGPDDQNTLGRGVGFRHMIIKDAPRVPEARDSVAKLRGTSHGKVFRIPETRDLHPIGIQNMVARANRIARGGRNPESCDPKTTAAASIMERLCMQHDATSRVRPETRTTTVSSRSELIDDTVDVSNLFAQGNVIRNDGYALAGTTRGVVPVPPKTKGKRRVTYVYATENAVPVAEDTVVIPHHRNFAVTNTVEQKDGSLTVELVDLDAITDGIDPRDAE